MTSPYRIRQTKNFELVKKLDKKIFPGDDPLDLGPSHVAWIATHVSTGKAVAFAAIRLIESEDTIFMKRAGTIPAHRGKGLHTRLIRVRLQWGRRKGISCALTYCLLSNPGSANNLSRIGMKQYLPEYEWAGPDVEYFMYEYDT